MLFSRRLALSASFYELSWPVGISYRFAGHEGDSKILINTTIRKLIGRAHYLQITVYLVPSVKRCGIYCTRTYLQCTISLWSLLIIFMRISLSPSIIYILSIRGRGIGTHAKTQTTHFCVCLLTFCLLWVDVFLLPRLFFSVLSYHVWFDNKKPRNPKLWLPESWRGQKTGILGGEMCLQR